MKAVLDVQQLIDNPQVEVRKGKKNESQVPQNTIFEGINQSEEQYSVGLERTEGETPKDETIETPKDETIETPKDETIEQPKDEALETPQDEPYKYKVEYGDTWYGIVQAKYGITDHAQTMEIARQLKAENGAKLSATNMPKEVILLESVTLKNGEKKELSYKDAQVDKRHNDKTNYDHPYNVKKRKEAAEAAEKEAKIAAEQLKKDERLSAVSTQEEMLSNSTKAFKSQVEKDGWAGKTADAVSALWGSKNRKSKVQADIDTYKAQLNELKKAAEGEDSKAFENKFKEIYGVAYNEKNVKEYQKNPTPESYEKAYGTKNNIGARVVKYNKSQDKGAKVVKGVAVGAVSASAAALTGGFSLVATAAVVGGTTMVARTAAEITDLATNDVDGDINEDSLTKIGKQAVVEGAIAGVTAGVLKGVGQALSKGGSTASAQLGTTTQEASKQVALTTGKQATETTLATTSKAVVSTSTTSASSAASGSVAKAATSSIDDVVLNNISSKVASRGGFSNLTSVDKSNLAKILGVSPDKLSSLSKLEWRQLMIKFHPDKNVGSVVAEEITKILGKLPKNF